MLAATWSSTFQAASMTPLSCKARLESVETCRNGSADDLPIPLDSFRTAVSMFPVVEVVVRSNYLVDSCSLVQPI